MQILIAIIIILGLLIYLFIASNKTPECKIDADCTPATCCHSESCVSIELKPNCNNILCSQSCETILDCQRGFCACINGKCKIKENE